MPLLVLLLRCYDSPQSWSRWVKGIRFLLGAPKHKRASSIAANAAPCRGEDRGFESLLARQIWYEEVSVRSVSALSESHG